MITKPKSFEEIKEIYCPFCKSKTEPIGITEKYRRHLYTEFQERYTEIVSVCTGCDRKFTLSTKEPVKIMIDGVMK